MKPFDERIKDMKKAARKDYHRKLKEIEQEYGDYYTAYLLGKKWNDKFGEGAEVERRLVRIYLNKEQNIADTFNQFMEDNEYLVARYGDSSTKTDAYSVDIKYGTTFGKGISVWIYYQHGNCERKLIRKEARVVEEPVYEIVCN